MTENNFIQCRNCPRFIHDGPKPGYYYDISESGFQVVRECDCHKKWRIEKELKAKYIISGVNTSYTFNDYNGLDKENLNYLIKYSENFERFLKKTMVYLYGPNGTMKTCMTQYAGQVIIQKGYTVQYTMMQRLIDTLTSLGYETTEEKADENRRFIKRCNEVDLLILDESFDKTKVSLYKSGFQLPYLDNFLRNRFEINNKSILFISNIKPEDISKYGFGNSLQDFVERNTKQSRIVFEYKYIDNAGIMDPNGIFKW